MSYICYAEVKTQINFNPLLDKKLKFGTGEVLHHIHLTVPTDSELATKCYSRLVFKVGVEEDFWGGHGSKTERSAIEEVEEEEEVFTYIVRS
jgi:hypothetical protein